MHHQLTDTTSNEVATLITDRLKGLQNMGRRRQADAPSPD
jgi:hypothetical protein